MMAAQIDPAHLELILKTMGIENYKEVTKELENIKNAASDLQSPLDQATKALEEMDAEAAKAQDTLRDLGKTAENVTGQGTGEEDGVGGLKGFASAGVKAEKAIGELVTGKDLRSLPSLLEGVGTALGVTPGGGLAVGGLIFAFEAIIPKVEAFIEKLDGAAQAAERAAERVKKAHEQMAKLIEQPTEEEEAGKKAIAPLLAGRSGTLIAQGIEQALRQQGYGISEEQQAILAAPGVSQYEKDIIRQQQERSILIRREAMMRDVEAGRAPVISEVMGMAGRFPGLFPFGTEQRLGQVLPEGIAAAKEQAAKADVITAEAERIYAERQEIDKANLRVRRENEKALQIKKTQDDREQDQADKQRLKFAEDRAREEENLHAQERRDAAHQAAHEQSEADREAKRKAYDLARAGTMAGQRRAVEEEAEGYIQHAIPGMPLGFQQRAAHHMAENYNLGLQMGATVEERIQVAVMQTRADMYRGMMHGMKRQEVFSDPFVAEK
jgi:hypothetical protein